MTVFDMQRKVASILLEHFFNDNGGIDIFLVDILGNGDIVYNFIFLIDVEFRHNNQLFMGSLEFFLGYFFCFFFLSYFKFKYI